MKLKRSLNNNENTCNRRKYFTREIGAKFCGVICKIPSNIRIFFKSILSVSSTIIGYLPHTNRSVANIIRFLANIRVFRANINVFLKKTLVFLGNINVFLGKTHVFLANINVFLGKTRVFLANTHVFLANTHVFLGNTHLFLANIHSFNPHSFVVDNINDLHYNLKSVIYHKFKILILTSSGVEGHFDRLNVPKPKSLHQINDKGSSVILNS